MINFLDYVLPRSNRIFAADWEKIMASSAYFHRTPQKKTYSPRRQGLYLQVESLGH
jgi:hypothetical protein